MEDEYRAECPNCDDGAVTINREFTPEEIESGKWGPWAGYCVNCDSQWPKIENKGTDQDPIFVASDGEEFELTD